ncbi:MAG TPA: quinohemoprotein amine dehydrogenase subunit beta [Candidatus Acidoferrales bacterium]|nr:quinohemoprotein amine dehydrogenase subunit beta [Candidatus Acidoferrales bacterium]
MLSARIGGAWATCAALAVFSFATSRAAAGDLIVTGAKPDRLFIIDAPTRSVRSEIHIPGANGMVSVILISPDQKLAYVLVDRMERVVGIDLATGAEFFRADLSTPDERIKSFFSLALTPDGKELIVYELPTKLLSSEYVIEEPRFAVFRTDAGMLAKPVRSFPAPRRVHMLLMRPSGQSFYAVGFDLYEYDVKSGKLLGTRGIQKWALADHSQPDLLAFWPVTEPSGVWTSPVYSELKKGSESVPMTALMSLDVKSGALSFADFEPLSALIFSTVLSPDRTHAYGVYTSLSSIDVAGHRLEKRVPLDHTFYDINLSSDGREIFIGGTECDVGFYDAKTLDKKAILKLPGCADQSVSTLRVIHGR